MYCNVLKYLLIEELHPAVTTGFDYDIDVSEEAIGITIQMSGLREQLPVGIWFKLCWRNDKYNFDIHKYFIYIADLVDAYCKLYSTSSLCFERLV